MYIYKDNRTFSLHTFNIYSLNFRKDVSDLIFDGRLFHIFGSNVITHISEMYNVLTHISVMYSVLTQTSEMYNVLTH